MRFGVTLMLAVALIGCPAEEDPITPPSPTPCNPGAVRCSGTVILTCGSTRLWAAGTNCADTSQDCLNGECVAATGCTVGQTRCNGTVIQDCTATDVWEDSATDCADTSQICTGVGVCVDDTGVCTDSGAASQYYVCDGATEAVACDALVESFRWDCADDSGTCYNYGGTFGADCLIPLGEPCTYCLNQDCSQWYSVGCGTGTPDTTIGCDLISGCTQLSSGCAPAEPFNEYCDGDHLVVWCYDYDAVDVPETIDCASEELGYGTCNADHCEHSTAGVQCSSLIQCVGGLTCNTSTNVCES